MTSLRTVEPAWRLALVTGEAGPFCEAAKTIGVETSVVPLPPSVARLGDAGAGGPAGQAMGKTKLLWRIGLAGITAARYTAALRASLHQLQPDIVHTNGFKMHVLGAWAGPRQVPLIWHIHDYVSTRPVMAKLLRIHSSRCSGVIANSASVAEDVRGTCGVRGKINTVWNAVDLTEFSPIGQQLDLDKVCGLPPAADDVVRFGLAGTLARWKGHEVFLRALSLLPPNLPVRGYIIGGPLYQTDASQWRLEDLQTMAQELGLGQRIGFTGFVRRPSEAMRALDVVVHASTKPEPFGLVIAEAMACRRAVIVSRAGGAAEITTDEVTALSHPPADARRLADQMIRLSEDRELRQLLGATARSTAQREFDRSRLGPQLSAIYRSVKTSTRAQAA
jgi:glycosyltransferase involved in cell wall biosynthesis